MAGMDIFELMMARARSFWRRMVHRQEVEDDLDEEIRAQVELMADEKVRQGMAEEKARRAAKIELGGVEQVKEQVRAVRTGAWIDSLFQDIRFALRSFHKDRGSVALALLALTLGIGASTIVFSVVYSVLLEPFPYKNSGRLLYIYTNAANQSHPWARSFYTPKELLDLRRDNHVFSNVLGGAIDLDLRYVLGNATYGTQGAALEPSTFTELGFTPELGRPITESDAAPGAPPVFLMSDRLWHARFNRDPNVLGTTMTINGVPRTLIGILPPRFVLFGDDIFYPMRITPDLTGSFVGDPVTRPLYLWTVALLKPDVTLKQATADVNVILHNESRLYPNLYPKRFTVNIRTMVDDSTADPQKMIYTLLGAVLMLLLIACSNVANLLLARATARERELAVRATLGASRFRLVRQLLVETFVLAITGAALGCLLAYVGLYFVKNFIPPNTIPDEVDIKLSAVALMAMVGITVFATLLCGFAPALHAARGDLHDRLAVAGKGVGASFRHCTLRNGLVAMQVGLSIVLLVGAGLMIRTFFALNHVELGINPKNMLAARVIFPQGQYITSQAKQGFFRQLRPRIDEIPGVTSVTESLGLPVESGGRSQVTVPGTTHKENWEADVELVDQNYLQTVGLQLIRGNFFSEADVDSERKVIVVNRTLVHEFFGSSDPIGRTMKFNALDNLPSAPRNAYFEIIGVVSDARNDGFERSVAPEAFLPYTLVPGEDNELLIRTSVDPNSILNELHQQVSDVDRNVTLAGVGSLASILHRDFIASPEFGLVLLSAFGGIGLTLSAIGVFGVMAYTVSLQTHGIGIRMALGAQPSGVLRMLLLTGLQPILIGIVVGLGGAYAFTRLMSSQIWGVVATDPWTFGGVVVVLTAVGLLACYVPARRAMRVDPMVALRHE
jgi:putative ABC transport system permease protein